MIHEYTLIQGQVEHEAATPAQEIITSRKDRLSITSTIDKEENKAARHTARFNNGSINDGAEDQSPVGLTYHVYYCNTNIDESVNGDDLADCDHEIIVDDDSEMDESEQML